MLFRLRENMPGRFARTIRDASGAVVTETITDATGQRITRPLQITWEGPGDVVAVDDPEACHCLHADVGKALEIVQLRPEIAARLADPKGPRVNTRNLYDVVTWDEWHAANDGAGHGEMTADEPEPNELQSRRSRRKAVDAAS